MSVDLALPRADDRIVVVTGAATGIGRGLAEAFARAGSQVIMIDIDTADLDQTADAIRDAGGRATAFSADVADAEAIAGIARAVEARFGRCDVLVNNAGILLRGTMASPDAFADWRKTLDVNLSGAFYVTHAFMPLIKHAVGCIVNVASIHAFVAVQNSVAYTASKGGLKQLTQALALELAPFGIRVNAVAPGSIATAMTAATRANPAAAAKFLEKVPLGRNGEVRDVVNAVRFLASDLAGYITGVTLPVDGGYLAL
jgi:NAD(P)-dependent dehydrogenase (short-subunit alcohol dehydrogenase family)